MLDEFAARLATPIGDLPSNFMLDRATYEHGNELGFDGLDFYICGRGGVLGDVDAGIVAASLVYCNPAMIRTRWDRGRRVMAPRKAAETFASCLHTWARDRLDEDQDHKRVAELIAKVISSASPAGAPLFAGWLTLPEPEEPVELMMHRLNALRELRGALHACAVRAAGLDPLVALLIKTPFMAGVFGWEEPYPGVELARDAWADAEAATNRSMGQVFGVLEQHEREELAERLEEVHAGVH
jgi:hypothetical protein